MSQTARRNSLVSDYARDGYLIFRAPGVGTYQPRRPSYVEGRDYGFRGCEQWAR